MSTIALITVTLPLADFRQMLSEVVREEIKAIQAVPAEQENDDLMTMKEACVLLKVTRPTVYKLMKQGKLKFTYLAKNRLRFWRADVEEYINRKNNGQLGS
jgi:excisionase family DNA binding protein